MCVRAGVRSTRLIFRYGDFLFARKARERSRRGGFQFLLITSVCVFAIDLILRESWRNVLTTRVLLFERSTHR